MPSKEERNLATVKALYEATGAGNWAAAEAYLTDDFFITEAHGLPYAGVYRGRTALQDLFNVVMPILGAEKLDILEHTAGGDYAVTLLDIVCGSRPDQKISLAEMYRFRDGKICEIKPYYFDPGQVHAVARAKAAAKK
jgi:predicted SnoaL-like aldol condensation-catalyzing enzyme